MDIRDYSMSDEEPETSASMAWLMLRTLPEDFVFHLLRIDEIWKSILPTLIPDSSRRRIFTDTFFKSTESREKLILGTAVYNRRSAYGVLEPLLDKTTPDTASGDSSTLELGVAMRKLIENNDYKSLQHLYELVKNNLAGLDEIFHFSLDVRWKQFCRFIIKGKRLPTKTESQTIWGNTDSEASQTRKKLGIILEIK